jgi:hypothetical protein
MHQTTSARHKATASEVLPTPQHPDREPRWVRVGRGTFPFSSFAAASAAYRAAIERLNLGVSEAPPCEVLDDAENLIARVAYNGRVCPFTSEFDPPRPTR